MNSCPWVVDPVELLSILGFPHSIPSILLNPNELRYAGQYPHEGPQGSCLDQKRLDVAGKPLSDSGLRGLFYGFKSDLKARHEIHHFKNWYQSTTQFAAFVSRAFSSKVFRHPQRQCLENPSHWQLLKLPRRNMAGHLGNTEVQLLVRTVFRAQNKRGASLHQRRTLSSQRRVPKALCLGGLMFFCCPCFHPNSM